MKSGHINSQGIINLLLKTVPFIIESLFHTNTPSISAAPTCHGYATNGEIDVGVGQKERPGGNGEVE
jgi:hypothetical protein